jgi:hypothetical protein
MMKELIHFYFCIYIASKKYKNGKL